jgi:hypothetical protein
VIGRLLGLATGGGWIPLAIAFALGAAGAGYVGYLTTSAAYTERDAKVELLANMTAQRDQQIAAKENYLRLARLQQADMDEMDAKARAVQKSQSAQIQQLAQERRAAQNGTAAILANLKGPSDAQTAAVSPIIKTGFDPRIVIGLRWLQCLQDARARDAGADACAGRFALPAGGSGAAGRQTGADRYAPSFDDQLWLLGLVYQFRDWGIGCFDDKRAIARSQTTGPKVTMR